MGYEVKKGDGWYRIAKSLGINVNDLLTANNATLDTQLHPGLKLHVKPNKPETQTTTWKTSAANDWTDQQVNKTAQLVSRAEVNAKLDNEARKDKVYQGQPDKTYQEMLSKDKVQALQQQLRAAGYDIGKWGADGVMGNSTNAALAKAEQDGWVIDNHQLVKKPQPKVVENTPQIFGEAGPEYAVMTLGLMYKNKKNENISSKENNKGQAFYISYPQHNIGTKGTGFEFLGKHFPLIKGHAASIIVDDNGNATYHTYGRYGDMGSYKSWTLPAMQKGENQENYLKRIRSKLEYTQNSEPVNATHIPSIDYKKARAYYKQQPEKGNYSFFDGTTCAGEACRGIDVGVGQDSSKWYDWLIPDTPENVRKHNYSNYTTYSF